MGQRETEANPETPSHGETAKRDTEKQIHKQRLPIHLGYIGHAY